MKALTLEEVKQAGRFAWHHEGWLFADGEVITLLLASQDSPLPSLTIAYAAVAAEGKGPHGSSPKSGGWHHLGDCDCEFCKEP